MKRVLAIWELGGGLGHVRRLAPMLEALAQQGCEVQLAARDLMTVAQEFPQLTILPAPVPANQAQRQVARPRSLTEILQVQGADNPVALSAVLKAWQGLFSAVKPDVILLDYAPLALFAAAGGPVPVVHVGTGFTLPPDTSPLPDIRTAEDGYPDRLRLMETQVLASVREARTQIQLDTPDTLGGLFALVDRQVLATWPELDPFSHLRGPNSWTGPWSSVGSGCAPIWPDVGEGPRIAAYLKDMPVTRPLLAFLADRKVPTLCHAPPSVGPPEIETETLRMTQTPFQMGTALAHAQLGICHGGHGTTAAYLGAGVPALLLPMHVEQLLTAEQVAASGAGHWARADDVNGTLEALEKLLDDTESFSSATAPFQARHATQGGDRALARSVAAVESLL